MSKIAPELHEEILSMVGRGSTLDQVCAWLKRRKKIVVSKMAISKLVRKHRDERKDAAKAATVKHIADRVPKDLKELDEIWDENVSLLRAAQERAHLTPTVANIDMVVKLSEQVRRVESDRRKALGLDQPDTDAEFDGLGELLGMNFKKE